jgi:hypothetical protein
MVLSPDGTCMGSSLGEKGAPVAYSNQGGGGGGGEGWGRGQCAGPGNGRAGGWHLRGRGGGGLVAGAMTQVSRTAPLVPSLLPAGGVVGGGAGWGAGGGGRGWGGHTPWAGRSGSSQDNRNTRQDGGPPDDCADKLCFPRTHTRGWALGDWGRGAGGLGLEEVGGRGEGGGGGGGGGPGRGGGGGGGAGRAGRAGREPGWGGAGGAGGGK